MHPSFTTEKVSDGYSLVVQISLTEKVILQARLRG